MEKYQQYVNSGFEWIGDIPAQWNNLRLRFVCEFRNGYTPSKANPEFWVDGTIPWYRMEDIRDSGRKLNEAKQYVTKDAIKGGGLFEAGSFILATTATIGEHAVLIVDSLANQRFTNLKIRKSLSGSLLRDYFFYYLFVIDDYCKATTKTSTFPAVSMELLKNSHVVFPLVQEQQAIVDYLDKKCSEIDNVISAQQKRIALLQELKQSVITHAVTKGLDPNVEMKDSGVEWIGEVPTCWKVMPIKHIAKTNSGSTPKNIKGKTNDKSIIKWVRTTDLSDMSDYVYDSSEYLSEEEFNSASCPWLPKHTVVVAMYGGAGTIGKAGILGIDSTINQALCSLEPKRIEHYKYLYYTIKALRPYWMKLAASSRKDPNISQDIIRNMKVAVPSLSEQQAIAGYLDAKCSSIDSSISKAQHQVELLQEYKQSLITEVVTGKRKVS